MTHLGEDAVLAVRDLGAADAVTEAHLQGCGDCQRALGEARERSRLIVGALAALDEPIESEEAKAAVRSRLDRARAKKTAPQWRTWPLGRAAAVLLLTAGAASALPWSPVRSWWTGPAPGSEDAPAPPVEALGGGQDGPAGGIAIDVVDGRVLVVVRGAAPGSEIEVLWTDGARARVTAPPGSGFEYSAGRLEVRATAGRLTVHLPRAARDATLEVDGEVYVRRSSTGVTTPGPMGEGSAERITFRVPGG